MLLANFVRVKFKWGGKKIKQEPRSKLTLMVRIGMPSRQSLVAGGNPGP